MAQQDKGDTKGAKPVTAKAAADGINAELALLSNARAALKSAPTGDGIKKLAQTAYDIASTSAEQHIPFVGKVAASLVELCQSAPSPSSLPLDLVEAHVDAVRAIVSAGITRPDDPTGSALVEELHSGVAKMVKAWQTPGKRAG